MKTIHSCALLALLVAAAPALAADEAAADEASWTTEGYVTLGSDYIWRGVSQTDHGIGIQAELDVNHRSGFYGQLWAGRMDFGVPGDGIHSEFDFVVGWKTDLGEHASFDVSLLRAIYPGANAGYNINYNELALKLGFADYYEFAIAYSDDLYRMGASAIDYEFNADWPIGDTPWGIKATAGWYDLDRLAGDSYQYGYLGAYYKLSDRFNVEAGYYKTFGFNDAFEESMGSMDQADSRFVAAVTWSF